MQNTNQRDDIQRAQLTRNKKSDAKKKMPRLTHVLVTLLSRDNGLDMFCEWLRKRTGHEAIPGLWGNIVAIRGAWLPCRVGGCRFHIKMPDAHAPNHKPWAGMTTCQAFHDALQDRTCIGGRERDHRWGGNFTTCTAYCPQRMCRSITQLWKQHNLADQDSPLTPTTVLQTNCATTAEDNDSILLNAVEAGQPSQQELADSEQLAIHMHTATGHASLHCPAWSLAEPSKTNWKICLAGALQCNIVNEIKRRVANGQRHDDTHGLDSHTGCKNNITNIDAPGSAFPDGPKWHRPRGRAGRTRKWWNNIVNAQPAEEDPCERPLQWRTKSDLAGKK